ncbi:peptidoglycan DD-metalloendopeptidase family protein [Devosia geojensis]|nr:peptidoglycan DD-metalloendopeptidase family protein [Devosia geojensis]
MSIRVSRRTSKTVVAIASLMVGAVTLSGCTALGSRTFGDPVTTGSSAQSTPSNLGQPMPSSLGAPSMQVAESQFLPPAYVGGGGGMVQPGFAAPMAPSAPFATGAGAAPSVSTQDLPALSSSNTGFPQAMPAQQPLAPVAAQPQSAALGAPPSALGSTPSSLGAPPSNLGTLPVNSSVPQAATPSATTAPGGTYTHTIQSGESLYTIARRYDVTTQALVQANALSSPDRIVVGQKIVIPGRADLLATRAPAPAAATTEVATASPIVTPTPAQPSTAAVSDASVLNSAATPAPAATAPAQPTQVASAPAGEPAMSGADKFRWPVSGRVITDFAGSKGTGINIEVPEGTAVKAAENGTVIYTGSGVEGYGNLVLVRHPNGYVSAYAHLQSISVSRGAVINRGDTIGAAGMTGSVSRPQLHFELRRGATPVDPVPMLAG